MWPFAALLRQNPRFYAGTTSPVGSLFNAMLRESSQRSVTALFIDDDMRERLLRTVFEAYYADIHPTQLIFDTNRQWTAELPARILLFPKAKSSAACAIRPGPWTASRA